MSPGIIAFEVFIILITTLLLWDAYRSNRNILKKYGIIIIGVLMFEMFTSPLWHNTGLGPYAYLYKDVSWIITLGWSTILLCSMEITDRYFVKIKEHYRFFVYLAFSAILGILGESMVLLLGIRTYSPEVMEIISGATIPFTPVPIEAVYYMAAFMALIIGFTKYFEGCLLKGKHHATTAGGK